MTMCVMGFLAVPLAFLCSSAAALAPWAHDQAPALSLAQRGAHRLFRQRGGSELLARMTGQASADRFAAGTTVPPPAPAQPSALTFTTVPPSETTIFSPQARLGDSWDEYYNETQWGRSNEVAQASANISTITTGMPTLYPGQPLPESSEATTTILVQPAAEPTEMDEVLRNESALDCEVGEWTEWNDCSSDTGDGLRSWHEVRYRPVINPHYLGGLTCLPRVMRRPCPRGGWSSESQQMSYTYGSGGTSDGAPGGGDGSTSAGGDCPCQVSLIADNTNQTDWATGENETLLLRRSRARGRAVGKKQKEQHELEVKTERLCNCPPRGDTESAPFI